MLWSLNVLEISGRWEKKKTECASNSEVFGGAEPSKSHKSKDTRREYAYMGDTRLY